MMLRTTEQRMLHGVNDAIKRSIGPWGFVHLSWSRGYLLIVGLLVGIVVSGFSRELPRQLQAPFYWQSVRPQQLKLFNSGAASFYQRINMIERAQNTIEVEYFIYNLDQVGRIFTQKLVEAALRGVSVRILVDRSMPTFDFNRFYAYAASKHGIQVRYYNGALAQHRNHRKLLVVDDKEALTGGRNMAEEYFDLSPRYNLMDRDIWVTGEVVPVMRKTFDAFWKSKYSRVPKDPQKPRESHYLNGSDSPYDCDNNTYDHECRQYHNAVKRWKKKLRLAQESMVANQDDEILLDDILWNGEQRSLDGLTHTCPTLTFISDAPGPKSRARVLRNHLLTLFNQAKQSILIDSPYFVPTTKIEEILSQTIERGVEIRLLTNSSYSTDAIYVSAYTTFHHDSWAKMGIKSYLYRGENQSLAESERLYKRDENKAPTRWGLHGKSMVVDNQISVVGTMNADGRSLNINAELTLICHDNEQLAAELTNQIEYLMKNSDEINRKGRPVSGNSLFHKLPFWKRAAIFLLTIPSHLLYTLL
jgi:cardiolipin synthase C